jgi:hypothetical protein
MLRENLNSIISLVAFEISVRVQCTVHAQMKVVRTLNLLVRRSHPTLQVNSGCLNSLLRSLKTTFSFYSNIESTTRLLTGMTNNRPCLRELLHSMLSGLLSRLLETHTAHSFKNASL